MELRSYGRFRVSPRFFLKFFCLPTTKSSRWFISPCRRVENTEAPNVSYMHQCVCNVKRLPASRGVHLARCSATAQWCTDPDLRGCVRDAGPEREWSHGRDSPHCTSGSNTASGLLLDNQQRRRSWKPKSRLSHTLFSPQWFYYKIWLICCLMWITL